MSLITSTSAEFVSAPEAAFKATRAFLDGEKHTHMTNLGRFGIVSCSTALLAALLVNGCGPSSSTGSQPETAKPLPASTAAAKTAPSASAATSALAALAAPTTTAEAKPFDPCDDSPPLQGSYKGILRVARCEQEKFLIMGGIVRQLGNECKYCHVPSKDNPKQEDYPVMTPKKEIANWMSLHLMQSIKPADGSPMLCKSCHTDAAGKPVVKILGNPRDVVKAQEWMSLVMVNKFVTLKGEKLKCKSCHVGNFTTPQFQAKVILRSEQIPPH